MKSTLSLVTLGTTSSNDLSTTIIASLPAAHQLIDEWIFVLYSQAEVEGFDMYLQDNNIDLNDFNVIVTFCQTGISTSINIGLSFVSSQWSLIVHAGDSLLSMSKANFMNVRSALDDPLNFETILVFGSKYVSSSGKILATSNHYSKFSFLSRLSHHLLFLFPWIPHGSTIIPSKIYSTIVYSNDLRSAMDYDFFLKCFVSGIAFKAFKSNITQFTLGGTSSNIFLSCQEVYYSLHRNQFFPGYLPGRALAFLAASFLYILKFIFLIKSRL